MKKAKTILFAGLMLLLTACHETYDHVSDAHDGISGGTIGLYIFIVLFCFAFLAGGVPLLVFGIRALKRKPERKGGPVTRVTFGGVMVSIGTLSIIFVTLSFFNNEFMIPESRNYKTVAKVLEKAKTESVTHFRCSGRGYNRNEYLIDEGLTLKDSLKDITYKSIAQKNKDIKHGSFLMYYVDLNTKNNGDVYPFSEIRIYEDGYCYVDYVKAYNHRTASFFYQIDSTTAKTVVTLAEEKNDAYRNRQYQAQKAEYEKCTTDNFFRSVSNKENVSGALYYDGYGHSFSFKKEGIDIISDFRYTINDKDKYNSSDLLLILSNSPYDFRLYKNAKNEYCVVVNYSSSDFGLLTRCYSIREVDAEEIYHLAVEYYKEHNPQLFDESVYKEQGKIEKFFERIPAVDYDLSSVYYNGAKRSIKFFSNALSQISGLTYTSTEQSQINPKDEIVHIETSSKEALMVSGKKCYWTFELHGDYENSKDYYIKLTYTYRDVFETENEIVLYYTVSDADGKTIHDTALELLKQESPEIYYYQQFEEGKLENFFAEVVKQENKRSAYHYDNTWYSLTVGIDDLVTVSNFTYTPSTKTHKSSGTVLRIGYQSPSWTFALQKNNGTDCYYYVTLRYSFEIETNVTFNHTYQYDISDEDGAALQAMFHQLCQDQYQGVIGD